MMLSIVRFAVAILVCAIHCGCAHTPAYRVVSDGKREILRADYRGDLAALARLRDGLAVARGDDRYGYLARYWSAYADWHIALNGVNQRLDRASIASALRSAADGFDDLAMRKPDFADALAASASIHGWLGSWYAETADDQRSHFVRSKQLLARALSLEPENPRVLWVEGGYYFFTPKAAGGDRLRARAIYLHMLRAAAGARADALLPDWGLPEAHMSLATSYLDTSEPELALNEANAALQAAPGWSYVEQVLLPQIRDALQRAKRPE